MEKLSKRILIKLASSRPCQWVARKIAIRVWRKAQKAPEVQERLKAFMAATADEQFYAHLEYCLDSGNELAKSKWVKFDAWPTEVAQMVRIQARLAKVENGHATASEIEEFRRLAGEVLRNWNPQYPPERKQRIEAALASVSRSGGRNEQA